MKAITIDNVTFAMHLAAEMSRAKAELRDAERALRNAKRGDGMEMPMWNLIAAVGDARAEVSYCHRREAAFWASLGADDKALAEANKASHFGERANEAYAEAKALDAARA